MKNRLLLAIITLIIQNSYAQNDLFSYDQEREFLNNTFKNNKSSTFRLSSIYKNKLDSIVSNSSNLNSKFTYDNDGYLLSEVYANDKTEYTWDSNHYKLRKTYYNWDIPNSQWIKGNIDTLIYDGKGNIISFSSPLFNRKWTTSFFYNKEGKDTLAIRRTWNFNSSQWENRNKRIRTYNQKGENELEIVYSWDIAINEYINYSKNEYLYKNDTTFQFSYSWNKINNQWDDAEKEFFVYDINGNMMEDILYTSFPAKWTGIYKILYSYDSNGNLVSQINNDWDAQTNNWIPYYKEIYSYDNNIKRTDLIIPNLTSQLDLHFRSEKIKDQIFHWDKVNNQWNNGDTLNYYYSESTLTGTIDITTNQEIQLYPNPAKDYLYLSEYLTSSCFVNIYDVNGRLVLKQSLSNNDRISLNGLDRGLYLINISDNKKVLKSEKILIE